MAGPEVSRGVTRFHDEPDWEPQSTDAVFREPAEALAGLFGHDGRALKPREGTE